MRHRIKSAFLIGFFALGLCLGLGVAAHAADGGALGNAMKHVNVATDQTELGRETEPQIIIALVLKFMLGLLGMVFMSLVILGGYWYISAQGDEGKVEQGRKTIKAAVFGLALVLMAYGITALVGTQAERLGQGDPTLIIEGQ